MIPHILHQSWKTTEIPYHIYRKAWVDSWREHHPDWAHILWTDEDNRNLVATHYPSFLTGYDQLRPNVRKADLCRFLYLHRFGGLYVDLDYVCLKNHEPLFVEGIRIALSRLSSDASYYHIHNAWMASEPGFDFWLHCAEDSLTSSTPLEREHGETHTGPLRVQWALGKYRPQSTVLFPDHLVCPIDWHRTNPNFKINPDVVRLQQTLVRMTPQDMAKVLPNAYAVTFWTHNWCDVG